MTDGVKGWLFIIGYPVGALVAGRLAFIAESRGGYPGDREERAFTAVLVAVLWPLVAAIAAVVAPFVGLGWLLSRPTRQERRAEQEKNRERERAETARLTREFGLPEEPKP
jgi:membrane protein required for beta-lactamase induction